MASTLDAPDRTEANDLRKGQRLDTRMTASKTRHRTDIDGLRAVAVTSVILLHAGVWIVSGGFLGVDVFFVISGYLIHKDLTRRLRSGTFAPLAFYGRRMRRTLPALYLVTAATLLVAWFVLMPGDFDATGRSAIATAVSVSNIFFLNQVGYFDQDALTKPLLHTWSLGVEEQFYLVAPLLSFALFRAGADRRPHVYAMLLGMTLIFCVGLQPIAPSATFFLMPTRIWEFLIGCAVADGIIPAAQHQKTADIVTTAAFVALVGALILINEGSPHPGLPTLVPCLATAAILHAGETHSTRVARWLGCRGIAFVGLISYSLYLWHWPVIVFARYLDLKSTPLVDVTLVAGVFALSVLSWRFVECPFRDPASPWRRRAAPVLATGLAVILVAAGGIVTAGGVPERFPARVTNVTSYLDYADRRQFREGTCFLTRTFGNIRNFEVTTCLKRSDDRPNYLLIGDSLAAQFWVGFSTVFKDANILQATASGCRPLLNADGPRYCVDLMNLALRKVLPTAHLDGIIFSASWRTGDGEGLAATVDYAKAHVGKVIVLGHAPAYDTEVPTLLGRSIMTDRPDIAFEHEMTYPWLLDNEFRDTLPHETFISLVDLLCPERRCVTYARKNVPLEFDKIHLTTEGSIFVARRLQQAGLSLDRTVMSSPPRSSVGAGSSPGKE